MEGGVYLKFLFLFEHFDADGFFADKVLQITNCSDWKDYKTKELRGTKVECVILVDNTDYGPTKDGKVASNAFEKITAKVPKQVSFPVGAHVKLINPKATIYGDYRNMLSITCDDIEVVTTKNNP